MSKQQVSRIKKVLTILLAVLFAVSLAAAAASNVNYYKKMNLSNGWHNIIVNFSDFGGAHFFETYTGDYDKNYTQHVEANNESVYDPVLDETVKVNFVEDINVKNGVLNTTT
jgi:6-phosphogluconate dehydrogenase